VGSDASLAERCRRCAEAGLSIAASARRLGISEGGVRYHAEKMGLAFRNGRQANGERCRRCAERGLSVAETARELGISDSGVGWWARKLGLTFANKQGQQPPGKQNWECGRCRHRENCRRIVNTSRPLPCMAEPNMMLSEGRRESELRSSVLD